MAKDSRCRGDGHVQSSNHPSHGHLYLHIDACLIPTWGSQVDGNSGNWQQFLFPVPVKLEEKSDANDFEVLFVLVASKS